MLPASKRPTSPKDAPHRAKRGFSFVETLVALLIVVMLAGFVAAGVPAAFNTYRQVVGDSNSQMALSTTTSALRDELGLATAVKTASDGAMYYQTSEGVWINIDNGGAGHAGLVKHAYPDAAGGFNPNSPGEEISQLSGDLIPNEAIKGATGGDTLSVRLSGSPQIAYDKDAGVFNVNKIEVFVNGISLENVSNYAVKATLNPA